MASLAVAWAFLGESSVFAEPLPLIKNVGVVPVQWQGQPLADSGLSAQKDLIEKSFIATATESNKFLTLNHDLIAKLWASSEGRSELVSQHELHGFLSLTVNKSNDSIVFQLRLLGPSLENYLFETETVSQVWLGRASEKQVEDKLRDLVFRLYNRLPVDVTITSIQGRFITLSGGENQNIQPNDQLEIVRASIGSRHPVNATWMRIDSQSIGQAKVVEVKKHTAVAIVEGLNVDGEIAVGDGAKVGNIASRSRFRPTKAAETLAQAKQEPVIVSPLYPQQDVSERAPPAAEPKRRGRRNLTESAPAVTPPSPRQPQWDEQPGAPRIVDPDAASSEPEPVAGVEEESSLGLGLYETLQTMIDYGGVYGGARLWRYSGAASAAAKTPVILVNHVGAMAGRQITADLYAEVHGQLEAGQTKNGSFTGFDFGIRGFMQRPLGKLGFDWIAGGQGGLMSIAIDGETFGGGDVVYGGGVAGLVGSTEIAETLLNWHAHLSVIPLSIGKMGIRGTMRDIESSFGTKLTLGAVLPAGQPEVLEWGGRMQFDNQNYNFVGGRKVSLSTVTFQLMTNYNF